MIEYYAKRGENMGGRQVLALLEDSAAAAVGIRERAYLIMNNAPYDPLEIAREAAVIHEYASWWCKKVNQAKGIWVKDGKPDIAPYQQGQLF